MGTRHLTIVASNGEYKVAQYGQWDGYPSGQGANILEFCRERLNTAEAREAFRAQLRHTRFISETELKTLWRSAGAGDSDFVSIDIAKKFGEKYPSLYRDTGSEILRLIANTDTEIPLTNRLDFAADSLFCEWAYVIDLDKGELEVYGGFNEEPVPAGERFANMPVESPEHRSEQYYPVRLVKKFLLGDLPSVEAFIAICEQQD